jgi:hypothetical protein
MGGTTKVRWVHRANGRLAGIIFEQSRHLRGLARFWGLSPIYGKGHDELANEQRESYERIETSVASQYLIGVSQQFWTVLIRCLIRESPYRLALLSNRRTCRL